MKFSSILILGSISLFLLSCSAPKFVTSLEAYPKIGLNLNAEIIIIEDLRKDVSYGDIKLPFISYSGQNNIIIPPLKSDYEKLIKETILENLNSSSSNSSIITIQILNASKEFFATFWSEKETSYVELKIIVEIDEKEIVITESGEYSKKSIDATKSSSEKIYQNALKEVTYKGLRKLKNQISDDNQKQHNS